MIWNQEEDFFLVLFFYIGTQFNTLIILHQGNTNAINCC